MAKPKHKPAVVKRPTVGKRRPAATPVAPVVAKRPKTLPKPISDPTLEELLGLPPAIDPFDTTPSRPKLDPRPLPGCYVGRIQRRDKEGYRVTYGGSTCIAYADDGINVHTVLFGSPIKLESFPVGLFYQQFRAMDYHGEDYPLQRGVEQYLHSWQAHTDKALYLLKRLRDGRPVDAESITADTLNPPLEDILDVTSSAPTKTGKVRRQAVAPGTRKERRKLNRRNRLAAMSPKDRAEWQKRKTTRRKELREMKRTGGRK